ncbi:MAG: cytochrome c-type biogenesis protein CcmH [Gammaproteobacteria bacterium]|jgi:cytochrome c-type biogenesis protein CcmH|nr:cytochrome c-type biogenesis protein CcmH [Gammaproteobacteria bacterium]MBT4492711.1 cytochrome c-type biogenesis protein CcmH [Gammaproteobacteria bacterium]MBT7371889.1 cytochrome c-type biogenesis protein CcmH [Gammaproteobacteria bacterium]
MIRFAAAVLLLFSGVQVSASGAIDAYPFPSEELQQRYDALIAELRCPQCLNTNLAGSDAMIAQDLRREVHRMLIDGNSDEEILEFMHERYGDFILYDPRISASTILLWLGPLLFLLVAAAAMYRLLSKPKVSGSLSEEERVRLDRLLAERDRP